MILACPRCSARFRVEAAALGSAGRVVRCGRCRNEWYASPSGALPDPPAALKAPGIATPAPGTPFREADRKPAAQRSSRPPRRTARRTSPASLAGWMALALLVAGVAAAVTWREKVIAEYPPAAQAFAAFGLEMPVPGEGLSLGEISSAREIRDGVSVLRIEGQISNPTDAVRMVPPLRGTAVDGTERELHSWIFQAPNLRLAPGESTIFRTEYREPAETMAALSVRFLAR